MIRANFYTNVNEKQWQISTAIESKNKIPSSLECLSSLPKIFDLEPREYITRIEVVRCWIFWPDKILKVYTLPPPRNVTMP